uniref:Uncharacterized protein n=1 Tax=Rhizophora mucronata TaxID=61149 RepID=A0A2P2QYD6_RHIMU
MPSIVTRFKLETYLVPASNLLLILPSQISKLYLDKGLPTQV